MTPLHRARYKTLPYKTFDTKINKDVEVSTVRTADLSIPSRRDGPSVIGDAFPRFRAQPVSSQPVESAASDGP
ncbi:hypothetical protein SeMB42_g04591 [Synchytrium endobioticum]|uniref:Uncharacterized protein n=1 Tax=Synchytrium endobioticum TaxID=286115 RepID=A0A507CX16_9FUNG|nr:hypothetical protein SeMB42_g04591 [Synchytrium endobioticum]